ncbi:MAG: radical SAM protein, partial [Planctomycetota bacterium]
MTTSPLRILLVQLPIPPAAIMPVRGNVPLAAAYLKMYAGSRGLDDGRRVQIDILPFRLANTLGDEGLAQAIAAREPDLLGFSCYLWNVQRSLHVAARVRELRPDTKVIIGGPEVTADNEWLLQHEAIDFASIGEGEQTFCEFLTAVLDSGNDFGQLPTAINGLWVRGRSTAPPAFRKPLPDLDAISSPYLCGILDAADEELLLLETIRGCVFKCKFCYYPKSYDGLYFLAHERISANLRHARERGAKDVVLLDPTLNQRSHFADFVKLLGDENPDRQFRYFGELRAEGINPEVARLLRDANFTEVEIGLQSVDDQAQKLMDRRNNMKAFEKGVRSLLDAGIHVKIDLIIGLPGDTAATVREGVRYLRESGLYSSVQVFQLAVLPGTAFRREAAELQLTHQPRPPYYVTRTPAFGLGEMIELMDEVQSAFECEFDQLPPPVLDAGAPATRQLCVEFDVDG